MLLLVVGLVLFLGVHSVSIFANDWRNALAARSEGLWKSGYTVASIAGFALICYGYGEARLDPVWLWVPPAFMSHLMALLMLPVFVLFAASYLPGRISAAAKHPQLVAVKLWALAHLLVNGTLADILLFGGFLAWAVADRISEAPDAAHGARGATLEGERCDCRWRRARDLCAVCRLGAQGPHRHRAVRLTLARVALAGRCTPEGGTWHSCRCCSRHAVAARCQASTSRRTSIPLRACATTGAVRRIAPFTSSAAATPRRSRCCSFTARPAAGARSRTI